MQSHFVHSSHLFKPSQILLKQLINTLYFNHLLSCLQKKNVFKHVNLSINHLFFSLLTKLAFSLIPLSFLSELPWELTYFNTLAFSTGHREKNFAVRGTLLNHVKFHAQ